MKTQNSYLNVNRGYFVFIGILSFAVLFLLFGCSPGGYTKVRNTNSFRGMKYAPGSFEKLWQDHTILISGASGGQRRPFMMEGMRRGDREMGEGFELVIRATLMDSSLMQAGIDHFAKLADMTGEEKASYQRRYLEDHYSGKYLMVWAQISTPFSDEYLKLDRWTFYLETESEQQIEPAKVVPVEQPENIQPERGPEFMQPGRRGFSGRSFSSKTVEFYFPLVDYNNKPLLGGDFKKLTFGVVNTKKLDDKASADWDLENLGQN